MTETTQARPDSRNSPPRGWLQRLTSAPTFRYIQAAMLVVLVIAFVTSFESGSAGARLLGYPTDFVAALPLVCDVIAGVATFIHGRVRADPQMRRLASQFVLVPMLLSWGANAIDHVGRAPVPGAPRPLFDVLRVVAAPAAPTGWALAGHVAWTAGVVLAAGICPVAVAALLHLSTKYVDFEHRATEKTERRRATSERQVVAERQGAPKPAPAPPGAPPAPDAPADPSPEPDDVDGDVARARELVATARQEGRRYGRGQLASDLGVSADRARKLLAEINDERPVHLVVTA